MFQHFHYPFSLRIPPRWKLIHGCLRCATVRLLTHSDNGLVPQCYRAYNNSHYRAAGDADAAHDLTAAKAKDININTSAAAAVAKERERERESRSRHTHMERAAEYTRNIPEGGAAGPPKVVVVVESKQVPVDNNNTNKVEQAKVLEALRAAEKPVEIETKPGQPINHAPNPDTSTNRAVVEEEEEKLPPKTHVAPPKTDKAPAKPAVVVDNNDDDDDTKIQAPSTRPKIQVEIEANITEIPRRVNSA